MFAITKNGVVTMDDLRFSALVAENLQELVFFWGLIEESHVVALVTPDLAALALAPTKQFRLDIDRIDISIIDIDRVEMNILETLL